MHATKINTALISVYYKDGLEPIIRRLHQLGVILYSTGGTQAFIESLGIPVRTVESLTDYPAILDGRVKTLHPKVFGGILAKREADHLSQLDRYDIPPIDLVIVDLYPFEETLKATSDEKEIIEKIDIGGISLIRAAAKNYRDVVIVPDVGSYPVLLELLNAKSGTTELNDRKSFASRAFQISASYDTAISGYFKGEAIFLHAAKPKVALRYGENPHQKGYFYGPLHELLDQFNGKGISYNNLVDIEAALSLVSAFENQEPTTVIIKHTNACGVSSRGTLLESWQKALQCDPVSAFGGVIAVNKVVDLDTASAIDQIFYEVLLAPDFTPEAKALLSAKKQRILIAFKDFYRPEKQFRSLLNGVLVQDCDQYEEKVSDLKTVTIAHPSDEQISDLLFANICAKHLKSNTIALVKDRQLRGMGCGQTSRVDALKQAIHKAKSFQLDLEGAVMASDAFFPFPDCVEIADGAGIKAVIQPGGSIKDQESIDYCDAHGMTMVLTGYRHFKH